MSDSHQSQFERQLYPKTILYSSFMAFFFLPQIEIDCRIGTFRKLNMIRAKYARCEGRIKSDYKNHNYCVILYLRDKIGGEKCYTIY